ncbi:5-methylcytosine-specific restriction endonuclease system specificity protein McrC [Endozoicomonas sp. ONNA1]|uniref:5-methylcytosine-specific restriction endonuclease system specificity protein McrC n=1 Tax=Endozoicomonas sp. ONNA1 TaxID=2828740 RepID=UPI0021479241|nr:5-methylcytosine-specific restriction endonuclease system specificity protein McrC [Endozoicomonas sp. ONNA1]
MISAPIIVDPTPIRRIGKIPVRNLWLLMLYASDLYRYLGSKRVEVEDNPEEIAELVAEVLCHQVEQRLMRNLSFGYNKRFDAINRVRGRVDMLITERNRLLDKGKVFCSFDELTINTPRNRYVREALEQLQKLNIKGSLIRRCRTLAMSLGRLGVSQGKPERYNSRSERFGRHDHEDQVMVAVADLVFSLALPTEEDGQLYLSAPDKKNEWLRKLFEKAVAGFYAVALDKNEWGVSAGKQFNWQVSNKTAGIEAILPGMKTDIIIDRRKTGDRLVIDTKFNAITTSGNFRENSLRSGYIYQMYAYLRSQEAPDNPQSLSTTGLLLHPAIDCMVNEMVEIQGHRIYFCTVDLGESSAVVRRQLLNILFKCFNLDPSLMDTV